jgi:predicted TIM-barrel fold metal-dependent hydrolase
MVTKWQESHREERFEKFRAKHAPAIAKHKLNEAKRIAQEAARQATEDAKALRKAAKSANRVPWSFDAKMNLAALPIGLLMLLCVLVRMGR